jgi:chaperonin cofactor prefoldin
MTQTQLSMDRRVARLEDEVEALERKVEALREEIRSLAHVVDRGDMATSERV